MKQIFPEFYRCNTEEYKEMFNDCYIIIDTNVLLNLYRYSESTRNELLGLLEKIKDQLWMPYQVGLEFHFNRVSVILEQKMAYENICKKIDSQANDFIANLKKGFNNRHPKIQMDSITMQIRSSFESLINDLKKNEEEHPNLLNNDTILAKLNHMYEGKVSEPYSKTVLEGIYEEGEKRYQKKAPPGYEDEKTKKDRTKEYDDIIYKDKFGDLIVWKQIIDKAKEDKKTIVFVTDDVKEDWWEIQKGRTIGPRIELLNEFKKEANVDFYMYKTDSFMSYIKEYLQEQVNTEVIKEMEDLREFNLHNEDIYLNNYSIPAEYIRSYSNTGEPEYIRTYSNIGEPEYIRSYSNTGEPGYIRVYNNSAEPNEYEYIRSSSKPAEPDEYVRNYNDSNERTYLGNYSDLNERIYPEGSIEVQREFIKGDNFEYMTPSNVFERRQYYLENIRKLRPEIERLLGDYDALGKWNIYKYQQLKTDYYKNNLMFKGEENGLSELQEYSLNLERIYNELNELYAGSIHK
ncbi:PIN-like domain-containing protein [Bacillus mycoides]